MNTYKKLDNGTWGAWIEGSAKEGKEVTITTKAGEKQGRVIATIITKYKSGCVVSLVADAAVAAQATARYQAAVATSKAERQSNYVAPLSNKSTLTQAQKAKLYNDICNEGGEGYNPYSYH